MLNRQYFFKARDAYEGNQLKLALIYLKKLESWDDTSISLLVSSAYDLWKQNLENQIEDNESQELVQNSFSLLLNGNIPFHSIKSFDYIRLTHLYLAEGNLLNALDILNFASKNGGYLENILIVLQSATILRHLTRPKDQYDYMTFLTNELLNHFNSTITKFPPKDIPQVPETTLPYYYIFLHSVAFLNSKLEELKLSFSEKYMNQKEYESKKKELAKLIYNLLLEGYFFRYQKKDHDINILRSWYNDSDLWFDMGRDLETSPFLLLCEDSYYESFKRNPLSNTAIERIVFLMRKYKRAEVVPGFLAKAILISPWNMYIRTSLMNIEKDIEDQIYPIKITKFKEIVFIDPKYKIWRKMFNDEEKEAIRIQSNFRGFQLRLLWPMIRQKREEICENHRLKMRLAEEKYESSFQAYFKSLFKRILTYSIFMKHLRFNSSVSIQSRYRAFAQQKSYREQLLYMKQVNDLYLPACIQHFHRQRILVLQAWHGLYLTRLKHRSSDMIKQVLFLNGYNQLLVKGMNLIISLIRIHKKHTLKEYFKLRWRIIYLKRIRIRAKFDIRWFVRWQFERFWEKQIEEAMKKQEEIIYQKNLTINYESQFLPLLRQSFQHWYTLYRHRINFEKYKQAILSLQLRFRSKKAKKFIQYLLLRRENQTVYCYRHWFRSISSFFLPWKKLTFVLHIQRFVRQCLAYKKLKRLRLRLERIKEYYQEDKIKKKKKHFEAWILSNFIVKYEYVRYKRHVKRIVDAWYFQVITLRHLFLRKMKMFHWLDIAHKKYLSFHWKRFKLCLFSSHQYLLLTQLFNNCHRYQLFTRWKQLKNCLAIQKVWENFQLRISNQKLINEFGDRGILTIKRNNTQVIFYNNNKPLNNLVRDYNWQEGNSASKKVLFSSMLIRKYYYFYQWINKYRNKIFQIHKQSKALSMIIMNKVEIQLNIRRNSVERLQYYFYRYQQKTKKCQLLNHFRINEEKYVYYMLQKRNRLWIKIQNIVHRRQSARVQIQSAMRRFLIQKRFKSLIIMYRRQLQKLNKIETSLQFYLTILKRVFKAFYFVYCESVFTRIKENRFLPSSYCRSVNEASFSSLSTSTSLISKFSNKIKIQSNVLDEFDEFEENHDDDDQQISNNNDYMKAKRNLLRNYMSSSRSFHDPTNSKNTKKLSYGSTRRSLESQSLFSLSLHPSSTSIFFQSEDFHRTFYQIKSAQILELDVLLANKLQELELIYCIYHAQTIIFTFNLPSASLLNSIKCSSAKSNYQTFKRLFFLLRSYSQSKRIILHYSSDPIQYYSTSWILNDQLLTNELIPLMFHRQRDIDLQKIETSRWPLTLPNFLEQSKYKFSSSSNIQIKPYQIQFLGLPLAFTHLLKIAKEIQSISELYQGFELSSQTSKSLGENLPLVGDKLKTYHFDTEYSVSELSFDTFANNWLGLSICLISLQQYPFLRILSIHIEKENKLSSSHYSLSRGIFYLARNPYLKEFYYYGVLSFDSLIVLHEALKNDQFVSLEKLVFSIEEEHLELANQIVLTAKIRSMNQELQGLSVMFDVGKSININ